MSFSSTRLTRPPKLVVYEKDAGAGGDCLYFSIYTALKNQNLYFGDMENFKTKEAFNRHFRREIAKLYKKKLAENDSGLMSLLNITYDEMEENYFNSLTTCDTASNRQIYKPIKECYAENIAHKRNSSVTITFADFFVRYYDRVERNVFFKQIYNYIVKPGNFAQELECGLAKEFLYSLPLPIKLHILFSNRPFIPADDFENRRMGKVSLTHPLKLPIKDNAVPLIYIKQKNKEGHFVALKFHRDEINMQTLCDLNLWNCNTRDGKERIEQFYLTNNKNIAKASNELIDVDKDLDTLCSIKNWNCDIDEDKKEQMWNKYVNHNRNVGETADSLFSSLSGGKKRRSMHKTMRSKSMRSKSKRSKSMRSKSKRSKTKRLNKTRRKH